MIPNKRLDKKKNLSLNKEKFEKLYGMECIECGACSYICPAKRPLTHSFRTIRRTILAERKEKK